MHTIVKNVKIYDRKAQAHVLVDVEIDVQVDKLARNLAQHAHNNVSGQAKLGHGCVTVTLRKDESNAS